MRLLRDYQRADFARVCEIDRLCFEPGVAYSPAEMASILRRRAVALVIEKAHDGIVGFLVAHKTGRNRAHIVTVDVLPGYRKQGIGRELILTCEEHLRAGGVKTVRLETAVSNKAAQALYESLGYTFVRRVARYYSNGEDAWVMEKHLGRSETEQRGLPRASRSSARAG